MREFNRPELLGSSGRTTRLVQPVGMDPVVAGYLAWLVHQRTERPQAPSRTDAGEPEFVRARQAPRLLARYTESTRPDGRRTP